MDSSVAAYLLRERGFEVHGVSFILWETRQRSGHAACCSLDSIVDASLTSGALGIKHREIDVRDIFIEKVIEPFISDYRKGLTPNPCILCNKHIKFPILMAEAERLGIDYISTGHYAQTENNTLKAGVDGKKDQSYFLYVLERDMLKNIIFPLGNLTKETVREVAINLNFASAHRAESQDICFTEGGNYRKFIKDYIGPQGNSGGKIVDIDGKTLGVHEGLYAYTLGQRRATGVAGGVPLYVVDIDVHNNVLVLGPRKYVMKQEISVSDVNMLIADRIEFPIRVKVKFRSTMKAVTGDLSKNNDGGITVAFEEPQWAPARGQSAVFYIGEQVIGGGIIV
ncbi:MAG: tRNA 2-thiouridine(34) synthase MnmA [Nitrospirae bacterium]|nr:tRNA 2-thiouridine(34) synthase MnmA [Nitrospirota bacterium]MBF0535217.1 tRNA 2-thiouridine(34) synthase MnmA [Nitrospirota bacterium]MBF0615303.1 tRNA 2-thiouridine(34) synthase MnmA [Nitrospirota bacterium]